MGFLPVPTPAMGDWSIDVPCRFVAALRAAADRWSLPAVAVFGEFGGV